MSISPLNLTRRNLTRNLVNRKPAKPTTINALGQSLKSANRLSASIKGFFRLALEFGQQLWWKAKATIILLSVLLLSAISLAMLWLQHKFYKLTTKS
ncbi:hypothetical protein Syn7502_01663 [Synechococcus sp. PCC 7502]|uniref:hypothetical protein n=1 Tax=Synechococcus sp. PCC 7502 TaxID=1173263 RepID=UPI00029F9019|nr:hypothetical protein [Synechococcus sp. PCC 7502]AFY73719.1 hypothetical protein Syn7502_01663 [Synechococcus sp. PCC 7502]